MKQNSFPLMAVCAVLTAWSVQAATIDLTDAYSNDGKTLTLEVAAGVTNTLGIAIPTTVTNVVKTGLGCAQLTTASSSTAVVEVRQGSLLSPATGYLGAPSKIVVTDGATLDLTDATKVLASSAFPSTTKLFVSGRGVDGRGAIVRANAKGAIQALFQNVTLTGPTTFYGAGNGAWGIGHVNGGEALDMGGYDLTLSGTVHLGNSGKAVQYTVKNPGNIILAVKASSQWSSMANMNVSGDASGKRIVLNNGAALHLYMIRDSPKALWTLYVPTNATATLTVEANNDATRGYVYFPTLVDGTLKAGAMRDFNLRFVNGVSGGGTLQVFRTNTTFAKTVDTVIDKKGNYILGGLTVSGEGAVFNNVGSLLVTNAYQRMNNGLYSSAEVQVGGESLQSNLLARLVLSGDTHLGRTTAPNVYHMIGVGTSAKYGVLDVRDGATVTNNFYVGANWCNGAVYLSGAKSCINWLSEVRSLVGDVAYGYVGVRDGRLAFTPGYVLFGRNGGRGYWVQRGGTATVGSSGFWLSRPQPAQYSHGELLLLGGSVTDASGVTMMNPESDATFYNARAVLSVGGGAQPATFSAGVLTQYCSTNRAGKSTGFVNVNANGTMSLQRMTRAYANGSSPSAARLAEETTTHLFLNFNGGTLNITQGGEFFSETNRRPTRVTVYAGGATVDVGANNVTWCVPVERPFGFGVKRVTLPADALKVDTYIGASRLLAEGGSGDAFSALSDFDEATRTTRGVIVTSPGFGWGADETPTIKLEKQTFSTTPAYWTCSVEMEELATTGGFTKKGKGTLTLASTNTWGGATRVEAGTLAFAHVDGFPGGDLEFPALALTNATPLVTASRLAFRAGAKLRVTDADALDKDLFHGQQTVIALSGEAGLASLPPVEYVNADGTPATVSPAWAFRLANGGRGVTFGYSRGTMVIFR